MPRGGVSVAFCVAVSFAFCLPSGVASSRSPTLSEVELERRTKHEARSTKHEARSTKHEARSTKHEARGERVTHRAAENLTVLLPSFPGIPARPSNH
jgi:hypothetical protein